uniref:Type I polyketide synthase n=1 Tax=Gambierdiscus excentricus TaxID=986170 RepID=A0A1S6K7Y8_9DINO|nr:type I polyketide synthase [Gambierdiscus excentricus]
MRARARLGALGAWHAEGAVPAPKMPPKRAAGTYDVTAAPEADGLGPSAELAGRIAGCLFTKGYCVCNLNVKEETLSKALEEAIALQDGPRFRAPPREVTEALLGEEGSAMICELEGQPDQQEVVDGPNLTAVDQVLSKVGRLLSPLGKDLGVRIESRSFGLLHSAGAQGDDEEPPQLTEFECQKWLQQLVKGRLMVIHFLGPSGGSLELQPFNHSEAPPVEVSVEPGATVVLRADGLSHRFTATSKSLAISCWLNQDQQLGEHQDDMISTPAIQELMSWATERIRECKLRQEINHEGMVLDPGFPREWQRAANRMFHIGPQVAVRGTSCKFPSTYVPQGFWQAMRFGIDWAESVPMLRWNHDNAYDPNEESWKYMKTCCRHGSFFDGSELFDNKFFGISNVESRQMDPMQRHILETSYEALFQAGLNRKKLMRSLIGVYIGSATSEFTFMPATDSSAGTGGANSITSNRISFCLGMQGPSYTIDTQGASSLTALGHGAMSLRFQTQRYRPNHTAMVGGVYLMIVPNTWVLACAAHMMSPQGRCFSFDVSADGFVKGEGVSNATLLPTGETIDGQEVVNDGDPFDAYVAATGTNHTGASASLSAPCGPQEKELVLDCVRQASICTTDIDAVECWAEGNSMKDSVEVHVLLGALRGDDPEVPLGLSSCKTNTGTGMEVDGMFMLLKVIHGQKYGLQVPSNHLSELNVHIDVWSGDEPLLFNSENLSNSELSSFVGMTARSLGGTMVHAITFGFVDTEERRPQRRRLERDALVFWPAGGGELAEEAEPTTNKPYMILGSWSDWQYSEPMKRESDGIYGYTVTLGENCFEEFQILLDGNPDQVLHPATSQFDGGWLSPQVASIAGPDPREACLELAWAIDGREQLVELVAEADPDAQGALEDKGATQAPVQNPYRQPAPAGTKFRVRLRVSGKFRYVEWERLEDERPS